MKIDVPIVIEFDSQDTSLSGSNHAGRAVYTLRYDTENDGSDALLFRGYPAKGDEKYQESGLPILAHMPEAVDKKLKDRAARNPYDYLWDGVSEDDRLLAQAKVDAEWDPTP
jgi:hypothetical protein